MSVDPDKLYIVHSKPKHDSHSDAIRRFEGDYECLANTYRCPVSLRGDPKPYPSVEHALQASKTDDLELKNAIRQAKNAIEAKKIARAIKPTPEWRAGSEKIVEALVRDKFRRNAKARGVLVGTGRVKLVYTNTHEDRLWGMCGGKGENKLGKLLERVRADALSGKDTDTWCKMRFELALPLDVRVDLAVSKAGNIVAEPSFEGKPVIRMGKLPDNEVVMAHPSVSRSHALLVVDRALGAFLIDLGASNGTFVDGRRLTPYVPEPVKAGGAGLSFAKSKRTYTLTMVETNLREAKKGQLFASMSDPLASVSQPEPDSTIYVGNLEPSTTEDDIREFFAESGEIASVRIPQDKETGKMRGIAFVAFTKHSGVLHALTLHMDDLKGQSVKIRRADTSKTRDSGSKQQQQQQQSQQKKGHAPRNGPSMQSSREGAGGRAAPARAAGGGGNGSDPALKSAIEVATAAVIRAAEAAKTNAAAVARASTAAAAGPASKRRKVSDPSSSSVEKRGSRWGDSGGGARGSAGGGGAPVARKAGVDDSEAERGSRNGGWRREGGREASGREEGRSRDGGGFDGMNSRGHMRGRERTGDGDSRGEGRGRRSRDDGGRNGGGVGGGEFRSADERSGGGGLGHDGGGRGRRGESVEATSDHDGHRRARGDSSRDGAARQDGGGGAERKGIRTERDRRDDRGGGSAKGNHGGDACRGDDGRRLRGGSRENGGGKHRDGDSDRRRGDEDSRKRKRDRKHGDGRRSRSRSRGRR